MLQAFAAKATAGETRQELVSTWDQWKRPKNPEDYGAMWILADAPPIMNVDNSSVYQVENLSLGALAWSFEAILSGTVGASRPSTSNGKGPLTTGFDGPAG